MAVYLVTTPEGETLVEARTQSQAINHVIKKTITAKTLNVTDLTKFVREGKEIETIEEAAEEDTEEEMSKAA